MDSLCNSIFPSSKSKKGLARHWPLFNGYGAMTLIELCKPRVLLPFQWATWKAQGRTREMKGKWFLRGLDKAKQKQCAFLSEES